MAQALPARPNLDWLRKTAKDLLRELRAQDPARKWRTRSSRSRANMVFPLAP